MFEIRSTKSETNEGTGVAGWKTGTPMEYDLRLSALE
jgi:hypothetical protein